ncbi:MAG: hypothetical protein AAF743_09475 [Planctomycetota bacterium]
MLLALLLLLSPTTTAAEYAIVDDPNDQHVHFATPAEPTLNSDGTLDVLLHLKGPAELVVDAVVTTDRRPMVVVISDPGLSSVYARRFDNPADTDALLAAAFDVFETQHGKRPAEGRLLISSFSAGYGGVRELLEHDVWFDRIDGLLMLDSIHAGFTDADTRTVNTTQMLGFVRFAKAAAAGEKTMTIVHARYAPPTYASTMETADHILTELGLDTEPADEQLTEKLHVDRRAQHGNFRLVTTSANDGSDHAPILRAMNIWLGDVLD